MASPGPAAALQGPPAKNGSPNRSPNRSPDHTYRPGVSNQNYGSMVLEADVEGEEDDTSTFGDGSSSVSITASIIDYEFENGRRYHAYKAGHYPMPNDESELDRLDLQHHIFTLLLNGELFLAPLKKEGIHRVLDVGTGTGLWAIEFADQFPNATVTGVDLSPIQPIWVPDNVRFEIDDVESEWLWKENYFDYVHSRIMVGAIDDWPRMINRAYKHIKPGGWIEFQDLDPTLTSDDGTHERSTWHLEFMDNLVRAANKYGKTIPYVPDFERWLAAAGFVDVKTTVFKLPMNTWPKNKHLKEVGKYQFHNYHEGYEAISIGLFTRSLGWTANEFQVLLAKVRAELRDRTIHTYKPFVVCYGRKPFPHELPPQPVPKPLSANASRAQTVEAEGEPPPRASTLPPELGHAVALSTDHASILRPPVPPPLKLFHSAASAHEAILGRYRVEAQPTATAPHPTSPLAPEGARSAVQLGHAASSPSYAPSPTATGSGSGIGLGVNVGPPAGFPPPYYSGLPGLGYGIHAYSPYAQQGSYPAPPYTAYPSGAVGHPTVQPQWASKSYPGTPRGAPGSGPTSPPVGGGSGNDGAYFGSAAPGPTSPRAGNEHGGRHSPWSGNEPGGRHSSWSANEYGGRNSPRVGSGHHTPDRVRSPGPPPMVPQKPASLSTAKVASPRVASSAIPIESLLSPE